MAYIRENPLPPPLPQDKNICTATSVETIYSRLILSKGQLYQLISGVKKYDHISPLLKEINWLPVEKVPLWQLNVWRAQHRIILRLHLLNDLTSWARN